MYSRIFRNTTILFAEDEERLATLMKSATEHYFAKFVMVSDGEEALNTYHKLKPDIVITDIMMPKKTGLELAEELKSLEPNLPIIILSAHSHTEKLLQAIDIGVTKYFIKPFNPDELLQYLATLIPKIHKNKTINLIDNFNFNIKNKKLYQNETEVSLTKREVDFISLLINQKEYSVDNQKIKMTLWQDSQVPDDRLRTFIRRLRDKTSKNLIENISSQGYRIMML